MSCPRCAFARPSFVRHFVVLEPRGVGTESMLIGEQTCRDVPEGHGRADLVVVSNIFDHLPEIVDFRRTSRASAAVPGTVSIDIPHVNLQIGNPGRLLKHGIRSYRMTFGVDYKPRQLWNFPGRYRHRSLDRSVRRQFASIEVF